MTQLTPRQTEVAALIAEGLSDKAIARELDLSFWTIRNHISRIVQRLPGTGPPRWRIMSWYIRRHSDRPAA
jgi:DNA-binding NarL/FixJ family response regulator